jgi:hypothetical protein
VVGPWTTFIREVPQEKNTCKAFLVISVIIILTITELPIYNRDPYHASLPPTIYFHFYLNLCYLHLRLDFLSKLLELNELILDSFALTQLFFFFKMHRIQIFYPDHDPVLTPYIAIYKIHSPVH